MLVRDQLRRSTLNRYLVRTAAILAVLSTTTGSAGAARGSSAWQISNSDDDSCVAQLSNSDGFTLYILAVEGQHWLGLDSRAAFKLHGYQAGSLTAGDQPSVEVAFLDEGGPMRALLTTYVSDYIKRASSLRVSVGGQSGTFATDHFGAAMSNIADCMKSKVSPRSSVLPTGSVKGAENWHFVEGLPNSGCAVRAAGDEIDTMLLLNDTGELILTGGRPDWTIPSATGPIKIAVDREPSRPFEAHTLHNLVLVRIADQRTVMSLRDGKQLTWELPTGKLRSSIRGLGIALDALRSCRASSVHAPD